MNKLANDTGDEVCTPQEAVPVGDAGRVLIFDSGVGGLSILSALKPQFKAGEFIYASDNAAFPYGTRSRSFLVARVEAVLRALIRDYDPDIVVVACNTASTVVLPTIRSHFTLDIVGVVPAIKPAAQLTRSGTIGLLGTPGTVNRDYTDRLIEEFAAHLRVIKVGSSELVDLAEQALRGQALCHETLKAILAPMFDEPDLDTVVLACTHFPLIRTQLETAAPRKVAWVDSGAAIARRVASLRHRLELKRDGGVERNTTTAVFTQSAPDIQALQPALESFGCQRIDVLVP